MNEKCKMASGEFYNPLDESLVKDRLKAKKLCYLYNNLPPESDAKRKEILMSLLAKMGDSILIEPSFYCDYGYNIEIGENFYSNHNLVILDSAPVKFGCNVFIGPNCGFYTAEHPIDASVRNQGIEYAKSITVGDNVWFGGNVTVLGNVNIGDNVVIGAGSVVVKDIPPNILAVGNPCIPIKNIT